MTKQYVALVLSGLALCVPSSAADSCCPAKKIVPSKSVVIAAMQPMPAINPIDVLRSMLPKAVVVQSHENNSCKAHEAYLRWKEWRDRNPNARSRYDPRDRYKVGTTLEFGAGSPEPDPGFGQCGCPPEVALASDGCGWVHSTIWNLRARLK